MILAKLTLHEAHSRDRRRGYTLDPSTELGKIGGMGAARPDRRLEVDQAAAGTILGRCFP